MLDNILKFQRYLDGILRVNKEAKMALVDKFAAKTRHATMFEAFVALRNNSFARRTKGQLAESWKRKRLIECVAMIEKHLLAF